MRPDRWRLRRRGGTVTVPTRTPVPVGERGGVEPGLEGPLVPPAGDHQPHAPVVVRLQQLESLEAVLPVDRAGPRRETTGKLVAYAGRSSTSLIDTIRNTALIARAALPRPADAWLTTLKI